MTKDLGGDSHNGFRRYGRGNRSNGWICCRRDGGDLNHAVKGNLNCALVAWFACDELGGDVDGGIGRGVEFHPFFIAAPGDLHCGSGRQLAKDGEMFPKLAYYEPKLNDIRTKTALSENTYFYGQQLTKQQADAMNKGEAVEISIATKKGRKTYNVTYSPRAERFITKSPEKTNVKELETKDAVVVGDEKKKKRHNVMSK